jgi:hypothetical protein
VSVSLRTLSDSVLLIRVQDLAARERKATLSLLLHLNEIERRKLHLEQGYSSMFDYCTKGLGHSEPAAFRRIRTARCIARFPEVYGLLEANQVSLNAMACASRVLTPANKDALLARIRGKSQREIETIVAEYDPRQTLRDVVRPVVVRVPASLLAAASNAPGASTVASPLCGSTSTEDGLLRADTRAGACEKSPYFPREGDLHPTDGDCPAAGADTHRRVQFQFAASEAFREKVERVKSLAWHRLPANASLEQVFELALDAFIAKNDPRERRERRQSRAETKPVSSRTTRTDRVTSRHLPETKSSHGMTVDVSSWVRVDGGVHRSMPFK